MTEAKYVIMAFDTANNSWDYCGHTNDINIARKRANSLAIGSIITFIQEGYISDKIKHYTIGY
jgi:hypothetical protein